MLIRITQNKRLLNKLVHCFKRGDNWVISKFDIAYYGWMERNMPLGWSPFGRKKLNNEELTEMINSIESLCKKYNSEGESRYLTSNQMQSIDLLRSHKIIVVI